MDDLYLRSEGIRGGRKRYLKKGCIEAQYCDNFVVVDNFEGKGDTYKQCETVNIGFKISGIFYYFNSFKELKKQLDK